jgi:hypothetical protein
MMKYLPGLLKTKCELINFLYDIFYFKQIEKMILSLKQRVKKKIKINRKVRGLKVIFLKKHVTILNADRRSRYLSLTLIVFKEWAI